jgi:general secretion pathway protein D
LLSVLENKGIARRLSAPSLSVLNGEVAQFQVGGEVPVSTTFAPTFGGSPQPNTPGVVPGVFATVTFVPFGVQLGVRPLVNEYDNLTVDLMPQVITPDPALTTAIKNTTGSNQATTAFQTRFLRTTAQLQDGESLLIGGLTTRQSDRADSGAPMLKKIPWLGSLFQAMSDSRTEFELLVLVNPVIVRTPSPDLNLWQFPTSNAQAPRP